MLVLTTSRLFSHRPHGLSSKISLSSSESSPLSSDCFLAAAAPAAVGSAVVPRPLAGIALGRRVQSAAAAAANTDRSSPRAAVAATTVTVTTTAVEYGTGRRLPRFGGIAVVARSIRAHAAVCSAGAPPPPTRPTPPIGFPDGRAAGDTLRTDRRGRAVREGSRGLIGPDGYPTALHGTAAHKLYGRVRERKNTYTNTRAHNRTTK